MLVFHYVSSRNNINTEATINKLSTELKTESRAGNTVKSEKRTLKLAIEFKLKNL